MRITNLLNYKRNYYPAEPVPFVEMLPLKLKPGVSGKGGKISDVCCIYEMSLMFACLKQTDFGETPCSTEIENFKKCYINHTFNKKQKKEQEAKGMLAPGEKKLSPKQLNLLLKQYPNLK